MSDWPADAAQIEAARQDPRWRTSGSGPFALTATAWIPDRAASREFTMVHRFQSAEARDAYAEFARSFGLRVEVIE